MRILIATIVLCSAQPLAASSVPVRSWTAVKLEKAMSDYAERDYRSARRGFKRLADHGSATAETMLGVFYASGYGVKPNDAVAAAYYFRAASRGYGPAEIALSDAFASGRGVKASASDAYFWALAASTGGDRSAEKQARERMARLAKQLTAAEIATIEARLHDWRPRAAHRR